MVGLVTPWNYPLMQAVLKVAPGKHSFLPTSCHGEAPKAAECAAAGSARAKPCGALGRCALHGSTA